jgi:hypothetical protein
MLVDEEFTVLSMLTEYILGEQLRKSYGLQILGGNGKQILINYLFTRFYTCNALYRCISFRNMLDQPIRQKWRQKSSRLKRLQRLRYIDIIQNRQTAYGCYLFSTESLA